LHGLFLYSEDGGNIFSQNAGSPSMDYMALEDRTLHTTYSILSKEMMSVSYRNFIKIGDIFKEIAILCFKVHLKVTFFF
jgi:hypothetical protein